MSFHIAGNNDQELVIDNYKWRAILAMSKDAGIELPDDWNYNDGYGYHTQAECDKLADALEGYLKDKGQGKYQFDVGEAELYNVWPEHVEAFIRFLRKCGGEFEVW